MTHPKDRTFTYGGREFVATYNAAHNVLVIPPLAALAYEPPEDRIKYTTREELFEILARSGAEALVTVDNSPPYMGAVVTVLDRVYQSV